MLDVKQAPILLATIVVIVATVAQIAWVHFRHGKVDKMLWVSLVLVTVFGGLTPILVSLLLKWNPLGPAYYVGALCLLFMLIGALLWRREERQAALA